MGYDDATSVRAKVQYAKQAGIGGVIIWAIDHDDQSGQYCGQGSRPLMNAVAHAKQAPNMIADDVDDSSDSEL